MSPSVEDHEQKAEETPEPVRCAVITVSDSRTIESDECGATIARLLESVGHEVVERTVVPVDPQRIALVLGHWLGAETDAILLNGGTAMAHRRGTVEVVREFLERELDGFGELFRYLSYKQVGAVAMSGRAVGGVASGKMVFAVPGTRKAVQLAMERLILPELPQLVSALRKEEGK